MTRKSKHGFLFLISTFVLFLSGCAEPEEDDKTIGFSTTVVADPSPNKYLVELKWNSNGSSPRGWFIRREEMESGKDYVTALEHARNSFQDNRVVAGKTYHYEFGSVEDIGNVKRAESTVTIPFDLELTSATINPNTSGINRLFLRKGARLQLQDKPLNLNVAEILSDEGIIESFPEGQTAAPQANGRPGGRIEIHAKKAIGRLYVYGRGEHGGPGLVGKNGLPGKRGPEGHYALSTCEKVDVVCNCGSRFHELEEGVKRGEVFSIFQFMAEKVRHRCITQTGDGGIGFPGERGGIGGNGGNGGDSSKIFIEISDPSALELKTYPLAGLGGTGGPGGEGGDGGLGGAPGSRSLDYYYVCREAHPGPKGPNGSKGDTGKTGESGKLRSACITLGGIRFGDCND